MEMLCEDATGAQKDFYGKHVVNPHVGWMQNGGMPLFVVFAIFQSKEPEFGMRRNLPDVELSYVREEGNVNPSPWCVHVKPQ